MKTLLAAKWGVCLLAFALTCGCQNADEIQTHRIPKDRSNLDRFDRVMPPTRPAAQSRAEAQPGRMVVGLVDREDATWFFKISGPVDQVNIAEPVWREFFAKLKFDANGNPVWDLPTGWSKGRTSSMRFATLNMNEMKPPLEMSISSLGPQQDLLANVNRWRGQLGISPASKESMNLGELNYDGGKLFLFDEAGMLGGGGPPMMPGASPARQQAPPKVKFDSLEGWEAGPTSSLVQVRLLKTDGEDKAQITVVEMAAAANEWGPNVKRWAGEIGMSEISGPEVAVRTSTVDVDGIEALQVRLIEEEHDERATIAVMAKRGQSAWFIKISGSKPLVEAGEEDFSKFLKSFKFPNSN